MFLLVGEIQEVIWPGHSGDCAGYQMPKLLAQCFTDQTDLMGSKAMRVLGTKRLTIRLSSVEHPEASVVLSSTP